MQQILYRYIKVGTINTEKLKKRNPYFLYASILSFPPYFKPFLGIYLIYFCAAVFIGTSVSSHIAAFKPFIKCHIVTGNIHCFIIGSYHFTQFFCPVSKPKSQAQIYFFSISSSCCFFNRQIRITSIFSTFVLFRLHCFFINSFI